MASTYYYTILYCTVLYHNILEYYYTISYYTHYGTIYRTVWDRAGDGDFALDPWPGRYYGVRRNHPHEPFSAIPSYYDFKNS